MIRLQQYIIKTTFILAFAASVPAIAQKDVVVDSVTYSGGPAKTVNSGNTIETQNTVSVQDAADVTFSAASKITLKPGFSVQSGSTFRAVLDADIVAPAVPAGFAVGYVTPTAFTLSWNASSDGGTKFAIRYEVFRNGVSLGQAYGTSMRVTGLTPGATYSMSARAGDAAGNWSAISPTYAVATLVDSDGDGLPDSWENIYGFGTSSPNGTADPDSDGLSNLLEFQLGTNPTTTKITDSSGNALLKIHRPN